MELPEEYLDEISTFMPGYDRYLQAMKEKPLTAIRINTNKISAEEFRKISPFALEPVPWCREGFYVDSNERPGTHPYYYAGLYYIQEPSAMAPASVLDPGMNLSVLDACAAPGGKSTALACRMKNTGLLVSNDISASRQNATLKNIERFGITNAYVISEDLSRLAEKTTAEFDRILLDAPCSGEGMFRRDSSLITSWKKAGSQSYIPVQKQLTEQAWKLLKPSGRMVYSTCTFSPAENEEVIESLCRNHDDCKVISSALSGYFQPGIGIEECMRLYPHMLKGEGHFAALLEKTGDDQQERITLPETEVSHSGFEDFMKQVHMDHHRFIRMDDRIFCLPENAFDNTKIRTLRSGLLMGTVKKDRFEPSQHLAFSLSPQRFENVLNLQADDIRVDKYLHAETIQDDHNRSGWVLVCISGYPLGFGKADGGMIKNKIEKGYRKI